MKKKLLITYFSLFALIFFSTNIISQTNSCNPTGCELVSNGDFSIAEFQSQGSVPWIMNGKKACGWKANWGSPSADVLNTFNNPFTPNFIQPFLRLKSQATNFNPTTGHAVISEGALDLVVGQTYLLEYDATGVKTLNTSSNSDIHYIEDLQFRLVAGELTPGFNNTVPSNIDQVSTLIDDFNVQVLSHSLSWPTDGFGYSSGPIRSVTFVHTNANHNRLLITARHDGTQPLGGTSSGAVIGNNLNAHISNISITQVGCNPTACECDFIDLSQKPITYVSPSNPNQIGEDMCGDGGYVDAAKLFDNQTNFAGEPNAPICEDYFLADDDFSSAFPEFEKCMWGKQWSPDLTQPPFVAYIDLGTGHLISEVYVYDLYGQTDIPFTVEGSGQIDNNGNPVNWVKIVDAATNKYAVWRRFGAEGEAPLEIYNQSFRFLRFTQHSNFSGVSEVSICGTDTGITLLKPKTGKRESSYVNTTISPNPSNGVFRITGNHSSDDRYTVYDINGRLILTNLFSKGTIEEVDLTHLENGMYLININNSLTGENKSQKLFITD